MHILQSASGATHCRAVALVLPDAAVPLPLIKSATLPPKMHSLYDFVFIHYSPAVALVRPAPAVPLPLIMSPALPATLPTSSPALLARPLKAAHALVKSHT